MGVVVVGLGLGAALTLGRWLTFEPRADSRRVQPTLGAAAPSTARIRALAAEPTRDATPAPLAQVDDPALTEEVALAQMSDAELARHVDDLQAEAEASQSAFAELDTRRREALRVEDEATARQLYERMMTLMAQRQTASAELTRVGFEQSCRALDTCDATARSAFAAGLN